MIHIPATVTKCNVVDDAFLSYYEAFLAHLTVQDPAAFNLAETKGFSELKLQTEWWLRLKWQYGVRPLRDSLLTHLDTRATYPEPDTKRREIQKFVEELTSDDKAEKTILSSAEKLEIVFELCGELQYPSRESNQFSIVRDISEILSS